MVIEVDGLFIIGCQYIFGTVNQLFFILNDFKLIENNQNKVWIDVNFTELSNYIPIKVRYYVAVQHSIKFCVVDKYY